MASSAVAAAERVASRPPPEAPIQLRTVVASVGLVLVGSGTFVRFLRREAKRLKRDADGRRSVGVATQKSPQGRRKGAKVDRRFLKRLVAVLKIMIPGIATSEGALLVALVASLMSRTWVSHMLTRNGGLNAQNLVSRNWKDFWVGLRLFFLTTLFAAPLNSFRKYVQALLTLRCRLKLSDYVHDRYLKGVTFYKAMHCTKPEEKMDNPDQRVTADVSSFAEELVDVLPMLLKPGMDMALFTYQLTQILGWQGPAFMYGYFVVSAYLKKALMPSMGQLVAKESELEGFYRTAHNRLIANAEEIAFYDGSRKERDIIQHGLNNIVRHGTELRYLRFLVGIFDQLVVKYWASIAGYATVAMPFILNLPHTRNMTTAEMTRDYVYTAIYITQLANAIGDLVMVGNKLGDIAGYTQRVWQLVDITQQLDKAGNEPFQVTEDGTEESGGLSEEVLNEQKAFLENWKVRCDAQYEQRFQLRHDTNREFSQCVDGGVVEFTDHICFDDCDLVSPDGVTLAKELNFAVQPGMNCMVTGPNGCGKSSLFRVIGELWPLQNGRLSKPKREDVLFVPQKPYLVLGTLRDQIIYPHSEKDMRALGVTDADLERLLATVDPAQIIVKAWQWNDVRDWFVAFSGGQKQRVAMARLFYHRPKFAILDECTSAVSVEVEDAIYQNAKQLGITIFTVSHRAALKRHHDFLLSMDGRGHWRWSQIDHTDTDTLAAHFASEAPVADPVPEG